MSLRSVGPSWRQSVVAIRLRRSSIPTALRSRLVSVPFLEVFSGEDLERLQALLPGHGMLTLEGVLR